jgi:hypothetical protein
MSEPNPTLLRKITSKEQRMTHLAKIQMEVWRRIYLGWLPVGGYDLIETQNHTSKAVLFVIF